jgi:hypothetical protein
MWSRGTSASRWRLTVFFGLSVLAGCAGDEAVAPPTAAGSRIAGSASAQVLAAVQGRSSRGWEDEQLRIEAELPGFGGMAIDPNGRVVINILPGVDVATARDRVRSGLERRGQIAAARALEREHDVRIQPASYAFSQLVNWKDEISTLRGLAGVHGIDADELANRVTMMIAPSSDEEAVREQVARAGVPISAIRFYKTASAVTAASLRDRFRPTGGGIQIRNSIGQRCTLGFNVTTWPAQQPGLLTASHCASGSFGAGSVGESVYQNSVVSGDLVGSISTNPAFNLTAAACGSFSLCANADAMFVSYGSGVSWSKRVAFTASMAVNYNSNGSISQTGWWTNVVAAGSVFQGQSVDKMGRTTGWSRGTVSNTCVNGDVSSTYRILCSHTVTGSRVGQGDSGAPVFIPPASGQITQPLTPLGVLFAGNNMNWQDLSDGVNYCQTACTYWFSDWSAISAHLNLVVNPNP